MRKSVPRKSKALSKVVTPSTNQMAEAMFAAIPELQEVLSQAEFELAIEDRGWVGNGLGQLGGTDLLPATRKIVVQKSRLAWRTDPLAKQAVRVWTTYCLGNGLSYEADDATVQKEIDAFFKSPRNEELLNPSGQQELSNHLLVDGDIFFAVFQTTPIPSLRKIDPVQIDDIITDPDDEQRVLCYRRKTSKDEILYYADWALDAEAVGEVEGSKDTAYENRTITLQKDDSDEVIRVYHLAHDRFGKWGNGLLVPSLNWSREHSRFMVARVAIAQALAKFATKMSVKGGAAAVNAAAARFQSSLTQSGLSGSGFERNPSPAAGSTFWQNAGIDMQATPRSTGAGDAMSDGRMLKLMHCAGTGVMEHYFGDGAQTNLATATAMELPMYKQFLAYQELWRGAYRRIVAIARKEDPDKEPAPVTIELPPILDEDLQKLGSFLGPLTTAFPETKIPEILRPFLIALGIEDIDDIMEAVEKQREVIDAQNIADKAQAQANIEMAAKPVAAPAAPVAPPTTASEVAALDRLTLVLAESNRAPALQPIIIGDSVRESAPMHITMEPQTVNLNPTFKVEPTELNVNLNPSLTVQPMEMHVNVAPSLTVEPMEMKVNVEHAPQKGTKKVKLLRDDKGRMTGVEVNAGEKSFEVTHDPKGRIETIEESDKS